MQIRDFFESTSSWPSRLTFAVEKRLAVNAQSVPLVRNLLRHHIFRDQFVQMRNHLKQGTRTTSEIPTKDRQARAVLVRHNKFHLILLHAPVTPNSSSISHLALTNTIHFSRFQYPRSYKHLIVPLIFACLPSSYPASWVSPRILPKFLRRRNSAAAREDRWPR